MGNVVAFMSISLDGCFADDDGGLAWQSVDEELHSHFNETLAAAGAFLDGRRTWQMMADYWPTADEEPDASPPEREFAAMWRKMPKVVVSSTMDPDADPGWRTTVWPAATPERLASIRTSSGGADVIVGGGELVDRLRRAGEIDGYRLYVHPVVLGRGRPFFGPDHDPTTLRLEESRPFGSGVVLLRYSVVRPTAPSAGR